MFNFLFNLPKKFLSLSVSVKNIWVLFLSTHLNSYRVIVYDLLLLIFISYNLFSLYFVIQALKRLLPFWET